MDGLAAEKLPSTLPSDTHQKLHTLINIYMYIMCVRLSRTIRVWFLIMCAYNNIIYIYTRPLKRPHSFAVHNYNGSTVRRMRILLLLHVTRPDDVRPAKILFFSTE